TFYGTETHHGHPAAQPGYISTGYYDNSCACMKGGFPYNKQVDTLAFYYKYAPTVATDSAQVSLSFFKNSIRIGGTGINLPASATYKYVELPFNRGTAPDTVLVFAESSLWLDSALTYLGADLKIDEMHFKSQPL